MFRPAFVGSCFTFVSCVSLCFGQSADEDALRRQARKIHEKALTVDTHGDVPTYMVSHADFDLSQRHDARETGSRIDFPRMKQGGLDAMFFAVYLGQGPRTPEGYVQAREKALKLFDIIRSSVASHPTLAELATTPKEARRIVKRGKRAVFIGIENGWTIGKDLSLLQTYYDLGARYVTLSHTSNNDISDSATDPNGPEHNGLSAFGEQVVAEMNRLGMMVDISHVSDSTFYDAIRVSKAPVIASHSSTRALSDHPRNMTDDMIRVLAKHGGVIQMNMLSGYLIKAKPNPEREAAIKALREKYGDQSSLSEADSQRRYAEFTEINRQYPPELATLQQVADHIDHVVKLVGVEHVGIGADLDGGGGVSGMYDVSEMGNVTLELVKRGYSAKDIQKIWSGNVFRVMNEVAKVASRN
ncbi:MAG: membrane dipeptidase [Ferruginibacter sp.]|nr:membrane dipeptidase [Cytophagales bacterium]